MSLHTSGKWRRCKHGGASDGSSIHVETDAPGEKGWFLEISAGYPFAEMADPAEAEREFIANCDLALAASQMLEALKAIVNARQSGMDEPAVGSPGWHAWNTIENAIAAAEGTDT